MQTLLDAKLTILDMIHLEKYLEVLTERKKGYDELKSAWEKMVSYGEVTILEYNKIMMELSSLNLDITRTEAEIVMLKTTLQYMTGNKSDIPRFLNYPLTNEPDNELIINEKVLSHPAFIIPEKEYILSLGELRLSKTGSLPEFQVGYSSEILPGETYAGPVAGLSIPLWSNANRVKTANANAEHSAAARDSELFRLKAGVENEISNMKALKKSIDEISAILKIVDNKRYLDIALANNEISLTTYFSDLEVMYEVEDKLIHLEFEYNKSLAKVMDHRLIEN
jgi:outer membrane protein TolC